MAQGPHTPEDRHTDEQILDTLGMIYAELNQMRTMMEGQQPQPNSEAIECRVCGSTFGSEGEFLTHTKRKHNASDMDMAEALKA